MPFQDRFNLLSALIPRLPSSALHVIPSIIPEAVLGTKEPSEKAREAAFEVILTMGRKMSAGGIVRRNLVDGMDEDNNDEGGHHYFLIIEFPLTLTIQLPRVSRNS